MSKWRSGVSLCSNHSIFLVEQQKPTCALCDSSPETPSPLAVQNLVFLPYQYQPYRSRYCSLCYGSSSTLDCTNDADWPNCCLCFLLPFCNDASPSKVYERCCLRASEFAVIFECYQILLKSAKDTSITAH